MLKAIAGGGLVVGVLDLIDGVRVFRPSRARPIGILHSIAVFVNGVLIHAFAVGLPAAYFARRAKL
jgi:hypothetical protein